MFIPSYMIIWQVRARTTGPGRCSRSKNFKTPFFSRYHKFLPGSNSIRSKTTPVFFVSKNLNKYSRQRRSKFGPIWAVAGRLIEQRPKFLHHFSTVMRQRNAENFKEISQLVFEQSPINSKLMINLGLLPYKIGHFVRKQA